MEETFSNNNGMMPENSAIRAAARAELKGNWTQAVLCTLVYTLVVLFCSMFSEFKNTAAIFNLIGLLLTVFVVTPLGFGYTVTFLDFMRDIDRDDMIGKPFQCFSDYGRYLGTALLTAIYTFLWSLLLIIPGIIKGYSYAMTPYIMKDHPELPSDDCINESMRMMDGYKWKLFVLDLSFIGWILLSLLTLCIGMLWVYPYMYCSRAKFYEELVAKSNK